ncbi:MAG: hypothetical protein M0Z85_09795, partial [Gammaproteobacteria bacterium]|nr:hypothetical protein [Gammaproteobacteria bacterium]
MGSTVTTAKHACVYQDDLGQSFYALYEQTYEKNVYPHTPRWSAVSFGPLDKTLDRIFRAASGTVSGVLQGPRGTIGPVNYVADWLQTLRNATILPDADVGLTIAHPAPFISGIGLDRARELVAQARAAGFAKEADQIDQTLAEVDDTFKVRIPWSLSASAPFLAFLATQVPAWELFRDAPHLHGPTAPDGWAYNPPRATTPPAKSKNGETFLLMEKPLTPGKPPITGGWDHVVFKKPDGSYGLGPAGFMVLEQFVAQYAPTERACPGHFRAQYLSFQQRLQDFPPLPEDTQIRINTQGLPDWQISSAKSLAAELEAAGGTIGALRTLDQGVWRLQSLGEGAGISFILPAAGAVPDAQDENTPTP